jgi:hypothetical protein
MQNRRTCLGNGRTNSLAGVSSVPTAMAAALAEPLNAAPDCIAGTRPHVCLHKESASYRRPVPFPAAFQACTDGPQPCT